MLLARGLTRSSTVPTARAYFAAASSVQQTPSGDAKPSGRVPHAVASVEGNDIDKAITWLLKGTRTRDAVRLVEMDQMGLRASTYVALFKKLGRTRDIPELQRVEKLALSDPNAVESEEVYNAAVEAYARSDDVAKAASMLKGGARAWGHTPTHDTYNAVIAGYARSGMLNDALHTVRAMREADLAPTERTFWALLRACAVAGDFSTAVHVWEDLLHDDIAPSADLYAEYIEAAVKSGETQAAVSIWAECMDALESNQLSESVLAAASTALAAADGSTDGLHELAALREECGFGRGGVRAIEAAARGLAVHGLYEQIEEAYTDARKSGANLRGESYAILARAAGNAGSADAVLRAWADAQKESVLGERELSSFVVDLARVGALPDAEAAKAMLRSAHKVPSQHAYESLIGAQAAVGGVRAAFRHFDELRSLRGKSSGSVTFTTNIYNSLLSACVKSGDLRRVKPTMVHMYNSTVPLDAETYRLLFTAAGMAGQVDALDHYLKDMERRKISHASGTYSALVEGYAINGAYDRAVAVLEDMLTGFLPLEPTVETVQPLVSALTRDELVGESVATLVKRLGGSESSEPLTSEQADSLAALLRELRETVDDGVKATA